MTLKIRLNEWEIEIEAVPDDCSWLTILNVCPDEEELKESDNFFLDKGIEKIHGMAIKGNVYINDMLTTENIIFVENYPTNIIGWYQLNDMGLLKGNTNRRHVVDVPPVFIGNEVKPGYEHEKYLKQHLIGDAKRVIQNWVRRGIIERCSSVCNSATTLTVKSNGKVKIIFAYGELNKDVLPVSTEPEQARHIVIGSVPLGKFYSVIKLYYGEWQIALDTNTKYKTAFTFLGKQYVWNRLPGKFRNTSAILSDTLRHILDKLPQNIRKHVTYYIDKMLISANTEKECRHFTVHLWSHLQENGFEMQETDNQICQPWVEYLGREISPEGIRLGATFIQKVQEIESPRSAKELRSILGLLEDARRFTPGFAVFTANLYTLVSKKATWNWDSNHQEALDALIGQIMKNRLVVPGLREKGKCIVQIFVIDDTWMAEVSNSARKPYFSESGKFKPVKKQEKPAIRELKAMKEAWRTIQSELKDRRILWEVECPEVARYIEDPNSLEVNSNLKLTFLFSPRHQIKVISPSDRKNPIQWPKK